MRISDWSSDVCSSDLNGHGCGVGAELLPAQVDQIEDTQPFDDAEGEFGCGQQGAQPHRNNQELCQQAQQQACCGPVAAPEAIFQARGHGRNGARPGCRSEEHTSELQSLMRISSAVFCFIKKKNSVRPYHT